MTHIRRSVHSENPDSGESGRPAKTGIRHRALVLGLVLAGGICLLTPYNNIFRQATPLGGGHFPLAPFFILMILTSTAAVVGKVFTRRPFSGRELLVVWILMVLVSGIAYTGLIRTFFINLTAPYHFATVENQWEDQLQPMLPEKLYPQDREAIRQLYDGLPGGRRMGWIQVFSHIPWSAWAVPLTAWSVFILAAYGVMICLVNLLSRQWIHNERMNFPLLQVPRLLEDAMESPAGGRVFFNYFLLTGILVPVCLHAINGLHAFYPSVPQIPTLILAGPYFPKYGVFSGFQKLKIYLYPAFIGFAFLTSRQISFSFWVFFILGGLLIGMLSVVGVTVPAASLGITFGPTLSRPEETQMIGAYGVFFLFILWLARFHVRDVLCQAFGKKETAGVQTEWFSVRRAFWFSVSGFAGMVLWCRYFGMPLPRAVLLIGAFFMVMIVAVRVICQGGLAYFTLTVAPMDGLMVVFGSKFFAGVGGVIAAVAQKVLFVDLRESLMPSLVHARKVTQDATPRRGVFAAIGLALPAGLGLSFISMLCLCYRYGIRELELDWAIRTTVTVYDTIHSFVESPVEPGRWVIIFSVAGALVMLTLVVCYHRFYWWPIHPIGYLTTYSSAMRILWVSFFIGWACNALCMRYGGIALFRRLRYFFVGLIIGDFLMGGLWALAGLVTGISYQVLPS